MLLLSKTNPLSYSSHFVLNKEKYAWVDYARGIVIILVVVRHMLEGMYNARLPIPETLYQAVRGFIMVCDMPLSFFLSGLFFLPSVIKRTPRVFITDKLQNLIWPFVIWSIIQTAITLSLAGHTNNHTSDLDLFSVLYNPRVQLWFVYTLFLMFVISAVIHSLSKNGTYLSVGLSFVMFLFCDYNFGNTAIIRLFECFIYFNFGVLTQKIGLSKRNLPSAWWLMIGLAAVFGTAQYLTITGQMDKSLVVRFFLAVSGIAFFVVLTQKFPKVAALKVVSNLGKNSFAVYLAHIVFTSGGRIVMTKLFHITHWPIVFMVGTLIGLVAPIVLFRITVNNDFSFLFTFPSSISNQFARFSKSLDSKALVRK
jgi:peptidoglycan/LPS O-acetylase OafA/YrhL